MPGDMQSNNKSPCVLDAYSDGPRARALQVTQLIFSIYCVSGTVLNALHLLSHLILTLLDEVLLF